MADLLWDDVKCFFDPRLMGSLPDVTVPGTSVEDWQAVLDFVSASGWRYQYSEGDTTLPMPRAKAVLSRSADAECPQLQVRPTTDVLAIFRFYSAKQIDFDVDLRELQGQERLDVFCDFLTVIGRRLSKPALMDSEGGNHRRPVLGFDVEADEVVLMAEPWPGEHRLSGEMRARPENGYVEPAMNPKPRSIQLPEMRAEVIAAVRALSDPAYQKRVWIDRQYPSPGYFDDFTLNVNILDDAKVLDAPYATIGFTLASDEEAGAMAELAARLGEVLDAVGAESPDGAFLSSPLWENVVAAAKAALDALAR